MTFDTEENGHQGYQGFLFLFGSLVGISPVGSFSSSTPIYKAGKSMPSTYPDWNSILWNNYTGSVGDPDISTLTGDICSYINSDYRLPERLFEGISGAWGTKGWVRVDGYTDSVTTSETDGTYDFIANDNWYAKNTEMGVCFPPSGRIPPAIYAGICTIESVGTQGFYWANWYGISTFSDFRVNVDEGMGTYAMVHSSDAAFVRCIHY
jgi:hypothetical protein